MSNTTKAINEYLVMFLTFIGGCVGGTIMAMQKDEEEFGLNKRTLTKILSSGFTGFVLGCIWQYYVAVPGVMMLCVVSSLCGYLGPHLLSGMGQIILDAIRHKLNAGKDKDK